MTTTFGRSTRARLLAACAALAATLPGCGGGDFAELFVKLITARFVPPQVAASLGVHRVELEVSCDRAGLNTPFGRLGIQIKLDPDRRLPASVTATPVGAPVGADGFTLYPCTGATADPDLKIAHVIVDVNVAGEAAPASAITLLALIQIEPLVTGEPSKDSTTAELALTVGATPSVPGGNLLINPSFADPADLLARYAAASWIAQQTTTVISTANLWQQAQASLVLPPSTRYVLIEIYAYEDVFNDAESAEFTGHCADEVSLAVVQP